jgi:CheY-like chemotaxis protein
MISQADIYGAKILVVDDQEVNLRLLEHLLASGGYGRHQHPRRARGGLHQRHQYDLIILDLQMPGMSGFEVMDALRPLEPEGWLPVLVIAADPDAKLAALEAGARDFISKPFDRAGSAHAHPQHARSAAAARAARRYNAC